MKTIKIASIKRVPTKTGKRRVLINAGTTTETWVPEKQFDQSVPRGLSDVNLIGCTINVEYFAEGEVLVSGEACTADNTLIKGVTITPSMEAGIASSVAATILASLGLAGVSAPAANLVAPKAEAQEEPAGFKN